MSIHFGCTECGDLIVGHENTMCETCYSRGSIAPVMTNIIAHGDGDGTIAAAVAKRAGAGGSVTVTQPFLIHKLPDLESQAVVVDIAVDSRDPEATLEWVSRNADKIVMWIDHHQGGEQLRKILGDKLMFDESQPSCPALMSEHGFDVPQEWLDAANACDAPTQYEPTQLSRRYNEAFKVSLALMQSGDHGAIKSVQDAFIAELVDGNISNIVTERAAAYGPLQAATQEAVAGLQEIVPGAGHVAVIAGQASVDITAVMVGGYKKFPIIVISTTSAEDETSLLLVGTNDREKNLVELFGLGSGNPSRIVLTGKKASLDYVREKLA